MIMDAQTTNELTDAELRAMRDRVFEHPSTDKNWNACKDSWRRNAAWLIAHDPK